MDAINHFPQHVAIIMDGNGRWAKARGKHRTFGHRSAVESVRSAVRYARMHGIKSLTLFTFSSENWQRPEDEVSVLMELFNLVLNSEVRKLKRNDIRLRLFGDRSAFNQQLRQKVSDAEAATEHCSSLNLNIAANYGGRWDMVQAARQYALEHPEDPQLQQLDETQLQRYISMADQPELDLMIRTGGEQRISNFLLWQSAYAELYFTDVLWPDFRERDFELAVRDFNRRQRRFGMTGDQVAES